MLSDAHPCPARDVASHGGARLQGARRGTVRQAKRRRDDRRLRTEGQPRAIPRNPEHNAPCRGPPSLAAQHAVMRPFRIQSSSFRISPQFGDTHGPYQRGHGGRMSWNRWARSGQCGRPRQSWRGGAAVPWRNVVRDSPRGRVGLAIPHRPGRACSGTRKPPPRWSEAGTKEGRGNLSRVCCRVVANILATIWQLLGIPGLFARFGDSLLTCHQYLDCPYLAWICAGWWRGEDSNLRSAERGRFTVCCH